MCIRDRPSAVGRSADAGSTISLSSLRFAWGSAAMGLLGRDWKRPGYAAGLTRTVAAPTPDAAGTSRTLDRFQPGSP